MKYFLVITSAIFFFLIGNTSFAQDAEVKKKDTDVAVTNGLLALQVGVPSGGMQNAIQNNMGNIGFGIGLSVLSNPFAWGKNKKNSPVRIGGEIGYTYYGRFITDVNIQGYGGSYKTSYGILDLNAVLQFRPAEQLPFNPFVEILAGGNFYLSSIKENLNAIESALGIQPVNFGGTSSASFNKGVGLGFNIGKVRRDAPQFTIRAAYNWGTSIKYIVRNSLTYNSSNNRLEYYTDRAPVRYLMLQAGIGF